jgi:hypothetical protein
MDDYGLLKTDYGNSVEKSFSAKKVFGLKASNSPGDLSKWLLLR